MGELLNKATQGVDPDSPYAFLHIFLNLMALVPWGALFWWNIVFVAVGALIGWWRGRLTAGVVWALLLGPIGWVVVFNMSQVLPTRKPPPLPR